MVNYIQSWHTTSNGTYLCTFDKKKARDHYTLQNGLLYYSAKIPFDNKYHSTNSTSSSLAGHPGSFRTYQNLLQ